MVTRLVSTMVLVGRSEPGGCWISTSMLSTVGRTNVLILKLSLSSSWKAI